MSPKNHRTLALVSPWLFGRLIRIRRLNGSIVGDYACSVWRKRQFCLSWCPSSSYLRASVAIFWLRWGNVSGGTGWLHYWMASVIISRLLPCIHPEDAGKFMPATNGCFVEGSAFDSHAYIQRRNNGVVRPWPDTHFAASHPSVYFLPPF